jgi:prepilin-type N-terminal cleavage/methylation domain-containing protein
MRLARRNCGFTLTEIAISLFIVALLVGFFMGTGATFIEIRKTEGTQIKLKALEVALAGYVAVNGRLPCPADGRLAVNNVLAGREDGGVGGCNNAQQFGVIPWATLGLSESDILDSWYNRIMYRVATGLVVARGMDMAACDPAGTEAGAANPKLCNAGCLGSDLTTCTPPSAFLQAGKGLSIIDTSGGGGNTIMNAAAAPSEGAAYVLISHGPDSRGAYPAGGAANPTGTGGAGIDEVWDANGVALRASYVDKNLDESNTATHFDDIVLRPSIMRVILRAERGPRAH